MVCLIRSKNKPLLDSYTDILGSEDAAYYVLSKNNGYSLEFTPSGERSDLFKLLLAKNNYDYEDAIREKAEMYYSSFYDGIGGDWTMVALDGSVIDGKGEPKINYTPEIIDFSDIISYPILLDVLDTMSLPEIERNIINEDYNNYISGKYNTMDEIHSKKLEWLSSRQKKLADSINNDLLKAFGLEKKIDKRGNITFVSKQKDSNGRHEVIILFCEYLENGNRGAYDQSGRIEAAANLIQISLTDADPSTINHELAHHYIRMFWNSEIVLALANRLDTGDRSYGWQVRLEERIVEEITDSTKDVSGFWNKLGNMIKMVFRWLSDPVKLNLLRKVSFAFRMNDRALSIRREQGILEFIDPLAQRVFLQTTNRLSYNFQDTFDNVGLDAAINTFIQDSLNFFRQYTATPNSILKDEYDEYVRHVKSILAGTNIADDDFLNLVYIAIHDGEINLRQQVPDPLDYRRKCFEHLILIVDEVKIIRDSIRSLQNTGLSTGQLASSEEKMRSVMETIIRGLRTRIYEYLHTVPKEARKANEIQLLLEIINTIREYDKQLDIFVSLSFEELGKLYRILTRSKIVGYSDITSQLLLSYRNTVFGFYIPILDIIYRELGCDEQSLSHDGVLYELGVKIKDMSDLCRTVGSYIDEANTTISLKITNDFLLGNEEEGTLGVIDDITTNKERERFMNNFNDQLIVGKLFEDINMLLPYIGLASRSRSLVIRTARTMILSAAAEIRHATLKDTARIIKLYVQALPEMRKLGLKELQSVFQEMDENGIPTGYFVRKLNYGKFYDNLNKRRSELIDIANQELKDALGENAPLIIYDVYNNPILPVTGDTTVNAILLKYSDDLDDWMCDNADRMFTADYYKKRRLMLSPNTRLTMSNLQDRINRIMSKCPIVRVTDSSGKEIQMLATWELSPEDQLNLIQLRTEYQQLGNLYYSDGTMKSGEELEMAKQIKDFNEWKHKHISYKQNEERFNAAIDEIRSKYGNDSTEEAKFRKLNTTVDVNPLFYDYVMSKVLFTLIDALDKLRERRNDLKKLIAESDKKGIDLELKRRQLRYWNELKDVDRLITEMVLGMSDPNQPEEARWDTYFKKELVMYDNNTTLLDHMLDLDIREYKRLHPTDIRSDEELREQLILKYQYKYTWHDSHGGIHESVALVSVFTRWVPKGASIANNEFKASWTINGVVHTFPNALHIQYSQQFSDIDPDSEFYNKDYDRENSAFVLPKKYLYDNNSLWSLIENNKNILKLYNALIELMQKNNENLPNSNINNYKLPQITARRLTILRRSSSLKELGDALKYNWEKEWKLNERDDDDVNYEDDDITLRVDGTRINTVPVRYVKPLDNKKAITSDVIGSVIAFTEMANNFVVKTQLASELEVIKQQLMDRLDPGIASQQKRFTTANTIKQLSNMMDLLLYGNTTKIGNKDKQFGKKELRLIKFMSHYQHLGRILMLGYNFTSMTVGFLESAGRGTMEALLGKDYTLRDYIHAWHRAWKYAIPMIRQAGSWKASNRMVGEMQWFGISKRIKESYHGTERNQFAKLLSENINGMFGFSLGDYMNSSFLLSMAMSHVRFILNNEYVDDGFYTKFSLIKAIQNKNPQFSYRQAKKIAFLAYKNSGITLEDAYEFKDGIFSRNETYGQYVTDRIENRVTGKCYQRLAEALGFTPQDDTPGYALQVLLRPLGTLRTYMFTMIARNWNWAHDFLKRYLDENGKVIKENDMVDGYLDIDSGNNNIGIHQGLSEWLKYISTYVLPIMGKKQESIPPSDESLDLYSYAAKKVGLEILSIAVMVGISTLFKALAKGADDDDWWYRFGYLTSVRLVNSFIAYLDPTSLLEIIKNISTLISPLNDIINSITTLSDMLGLSGHSPFEEIKSGSYNGRTRLFRNIMRITPLGNAYEDLTSSALKSRTNWYLLQDALVWSTLGGMYDLLFGTDTGSKK